MNKCSCYDPSFGGLCKGTKEVESCYCEGDENKCDFYPDMPAKAIEPETARASPQMDAVTFLKQMNRMCDSVDCEDCPIEREIGDNTIDCIRWTEKYPEKAVELVSQWAAAHSEPTTWNQWLHTLQEHYGNFGISSFIEWLNTPIPEDAKEKFNIR